MCCERLLNKLESRLSGIKSIRKFDGSASIACRHVVSLERFRVGHLAVV